ncbi:MAG: 2,3-bisphosphoglycerate-dependent phosphoglycerate mutase [Solirubrobacteraceae bacterium]|jgi:probable phosphoglycerate mutase|nr:2,3-bisphosphoglycerate-dependent phosphoglycerate mutase [Solirubrobacteraceae bacterium]
MAGSNEVLLVRHGETDENALARFQGRIDTELNERGREQSRALAQAVRDEGLCALYCSPLRRALQTARIVGAAIGLQPILDERLVEADAGAWSGRLIADILAGERAEYARWRAADPTFRFPGGESVAEQSQRIAAALADVAAGPLPALVVTHGGTIRAIEGIEPPPDGSVPNCAVIRLRGDRLPAPSARP